MHCFMLFLALFALVANTLAIALPTRHANESITIAAQNWLKDTKIVSDFLDFAVSLPSGTPPDLLRHAAAALDAELDELEHKAILDTYFHEANQKVFFANAVLAKAGIFQFVVDKLHDITKNGSLEEDVNAINIARCAWILPAIDVYFEQVAIATNQTVFELAFRPLACPVGSNFPPRV